MPSTFDESELMDRVDNDMDLLRETVEMLSADGPALLAEVRRAAAAGDVAAVARAAHSLKGMISNFCSPAASAAALAVEQIGRSGDLSPLPVAVEALDAALGALIAELEQYVSHGDRAT